MHFTNRDVIGFTSHLTSEERAPATREKYERDVRYFLEFTERDGGRVNKETVIRYKNHLGEKYAPTSANSMIAALNSFFRWAGVPHLAVKRFKVQRESFSSEEKELTREEYLRLINSAEARGDLRLSLMLQTICSTGIRVSELAFITLRAVHSGEARVFSKGKSRRVFILPRLQKKLKDFARKSGISSGAIFVSSSGAPISRNRVWREMKSLCQAARVSPKKVFPHNLRHLFARSFLEVDKDVVKLADILGHSNINTTRIYTVSSGAEHRRKMQMLRLIS